MLTCYLLSDCGHSICGLCQKRQVDQSATRCPVCNVNLVCYIPIIALRNAARELACTWKHCKRQITAKAVVSHKNECGEIPLQCNTPPEKFPKNPLGFHECPNDITDCTCGARVKRMEIQQHKMHHCPCLPVFCPLACGLELARYFTCLIVVVIVTLDPIQCILTSFTYLVLWNSAVELEEMRWKRTLHGICVHRKI